MDALLHPSLPSLTTLRSGKVREVYDIGENLLLVASDRLSAFDVILPTGIPDKGRVLNQLSAFWFERFASLVPNHLLSIDDADVAKVVGADRPELHGRCAIVKKCRPFPVEAVVRGYLDGSWWKAYKSGERVILGEELPDGLERGSKLPRPIFTPATKAESGHDENITFDQAAEIMGADHAEEVRETSLRIYREAAAHAESCGLILADTKFEFGLHDGKVLWIDEALTPDSSRYWEAALWKPGGAQASFDKQFVRDYLETLDWDKQPPGPELPDEVVQRTREKYRDAFSRLTGRELQR